MKNFVNIALGLLAFPAVASANLAEPRSMWENEIKKRCPAHHVDWVGDGAYPAIIDAYYARLSKKVRKDLQKYAKYSQTCAKESSGYSCEWAVHIDVVQKLSLLSNFVNWACKNVYCNEPNVCKISFK